MSSPSLAVSARARVSLAVFRGVRWPELNARNRRTINNKTTFLNSNSNSHNTISSKQPTRRWCLTRNFNSESVKVLFKSTYSSSSSSLAKSLSKSVGRHLSLSCTVSFRFSTPRLHQVFLYSVQPSFSV